MKRIDKVDLLLDLLAMTWVILAGVTLYYKFTPRVITLDPTKAQVFKMMADDFEKLKAGEGDQKDLQRRLNIESNYLIGTPIPKGNNVK